MKFVPLFDMVLIRIGKAEEVTKGGIVLPDSARQKPDEGEVISKGPNANAVKEGDKVVFGKYVGVSLTVEGLSGELLLLHETDILGILKGGGE